MFGYADSFGKRLHHHSGFLAHNKRGEVRILGCHSQRFRQPHSVILTGNVTTSPLTVTRAGTGSGTVTSSPAKIDCGATCSASFPSGTVVSLTATPAVALRSMAGVVRAAEPPVAL